MVEAREAELTGDAAAALQRFARRAQRLAGATGAAGGSRRVVAAYERALRAGTREGPSGRTWRSFYLLLDDFVGEVLDDAGCIDDEQSATLAQMELLLDDDLGRDLFDEPHRAARRGLFARFERTAR